MDYVLFITMLAHAEYAANSRPISYVTNQDLNLPLTPQMLLYGRNLNVGGHDSEFDSLDPDFTLVKKEFLNGMFKKLLKKLETFKVSLPPIILISSFLSSAYSD